MRVKTRTWLSQERAQKGISCPWTSLGTGGVGLRMEGFPGTQGRFCAWFIGKDAQAPGLARVPQRRRIVGMEPKGSLYFPSFSLDGSHLMCLCSTDSGVTVRPLSQNFREERQVHKEEALAKANVQQWPLQTQALAMSLMLILANTPVLGLPATKG